MNDIKNIAANDVPEAAESVLHHLNLNEAGKPDVSTVRVAERVGLPPSAAGYAIALQSQEGDAADSINAWVNLCTKAAYEACLAYTVEALRLEQEGDGDNVTYDNIRNAGRVAYRMCLPPITTRRRAQAYIACVAAGMSGGWLAGEEARAMLYAAQLAMSCHMGTNHKPRASRAKKKGGTA